MDALREWLSKYSTTEMRGGESCIVIMTLDEEEMTELRRLLTFSTEKLGKRFINALSELGIDACQECRSIINDSKCKCRKESVA